MVAKKGKSGKAVPAAPIGGAAPKAVKKNPMFEKKPRNFRIGGDVMPKRDLTRFTKWPQYVRLQRQKRIMLQRLKVPPTLAQFQNTIDKNQFLQLARIMKSIAPETKQQKKERLAGMAKNAAKGKESNTSGLPVVKFGLNHVTQLVEDNKAKLVVIAHDVEPLELICWLPALCRKKDIPYCFVKSKARLGKFVNKKTASCLAITSVKKESQKDLDVFAGNMRSAYNDNVEARRKWGGGICGVKSLHVQQYRARLVEKENAKKMGLKA